VLKDTSHHDTCSGTSFNIYIIAKCIWIIPDKIIGASKMCISDASLGLCSSQHGITVLMIQLSS